MMKRSSCGEQSKPAKVRRVVKVLMVEQGEANEDVATAKSKHLYF